ncbi:TPA: hypothetical protein ACH3X1_003352 [Trebouxia sp. C0004]
MKHERVTKMVQVKKMLHANKPKRVKNARKAQVQPGEEAHDYEFGSAAASAASTYFQGNSAGNLEALPDLVEEFDECVNEWLYDLELEGLTSGKERDVTQNGIVVKAPLAANFGTTLEVLSDSNVDKL